jgi:hypothetical protein
VCVSHHRLRQRLARKQPPPLKPGGRKRRRKRKREKREERKSTLSVFFFFYFFFFALFPPLFLLWTPFLGVFFLSRLILSSQRNRYYNLGFLIFKEKCRVSVSFAILAHIIIERLFFVLQ